MSKSAVFNIAGTVKKLDGALDRIRGNLTRRSLREALVPVRAMQRTAIGAAKYREGRATANAAREMAHAAREGRRARGERLGPKPKVAKGGANPRIVREAIAKAITVKDERVPGGFVAAVGVDIGKSGLRTQQRQIVFLEAGAKRKRRGIPANPRLRTINEQQQRPAEARFLQLMERGILDGG